MTEAPPTPIQDLEQVVVRFAGDSGDGMQLTGSQFTHTTALMGNDIATFPDFPAEIRAPTGTLPGVSAFQLRFSSVDIHTPGDQPDALVAMNPAALKVHAGDLKPGGLLILNTANFRESDLRKAKYDVDPREDGSLDGYRLVEIDLVKLNREALKDSPLDNRSKDRCKNMFALGILYWLYNREVEPTVQSIQAKFGKKNPDVAEANIKVLNAGYAYADIAGLFQTSYRVKPAEFQKPGRYRNIMGNQALCLGLVAAAKRAGIQAFLGSYPITPASDILHQLSGYKHHGVFTFQAEDEIAAVCAAIGAAYAGKLGITSTSGPGLALKAEAIGLAVMTELPLVVINVQRAGPSTGMPTKTEQADLLQSMFGRNGESPVGVVAVSTPGDAFDAAYEAVRIALTHMTPVILLSDGYIANGSEPWKLPVAEDLPEIPIEYATKPNSEDGETFFPYLRNPKDHVRPWALPGTPGLMHRIGGLEKQDVTGNISYDADNHQLMTDLRAAKVAKIADDVDPATTLGPSKGDVLVVSWGGTRGAVTSAVHTLRDEGHAVSAMFLRWLNPLPHGVEAILRSFKHVILPEVNGGQLAMMLRAQFLIDIDSYAKVQGRPFTSEEIEQRVRQALTEAAK